MRVKGVMYTLNESADTISYDSSQSRLNAITVQDAIDDVNVKIENILGNENYDISNFVQNSYWNVRDKNVGDTYNGTIEEYEGSYYRTSERLTVSEGDTITISTKGSAYGARGWTICSLSNIILDIAPTPSDTLSNPYEYTATEDCYVYVNSIVNQAFIEIRKSKDRIALIEDNLTELNNSIEDVDKIDTLSEDVAEIKNYIYGTNTFNISDFVQNTYWSLRDKNVGDTYSGGFVEQEGNYYKLERLNLSEGDTITIATKGSSAAARGWAICSLNNIILDIAPAPSDTLTNPYEYTATEDCYVYVNSIVNQANIEIIKPIDRLTSIEDNLTELNNSIEEVDTLSEDVAEIKNDFYGTNTLLEPINTLSGIGISTSGVLTEISGDYNTRMFEVSEGDVLHYVLERSSYGTGTRKSGSFYYTEDDVNYTLKSYNEFPNWVKSETQSLDFYVTVPSGVNRAAMYAGNLEKYIVIKDVTKVVKSDLQNVIEEVDAHPNTELNNRLLILENETSIGGASKIVNLSPNFSKSNLRVLSIGNSFTQNSLYYLDEFITAAGITLYDSNWSYYVASRGGATFKTWYDVWYNNNLYSSAYGIAKKAGATIDYGGGSKEVMPDSVYQNGEEFRNLIKNGNWDLIIIQQKSDFNNDYTLYEGNVDGGYLKEFINLLKTYNPNASIGYMNPQASPQNNPNTVERWSQMANTTKWMQIQYGVDFIVPIATAIENIRQSSITTNAAHKLTEDNHHLANGLGKYVSAATLFQTLIGNRYGISVYGNSFRTEAGTAPSGYESDCIDVLTDSVAHTAQIAALLACSNMYEIRNPDEFTFDVNV